MSDRPPTDGDDLWSEVLDQVADALTDADLGDPGTRDALLQGVRDALEGMGGAIDMDIQVVTEGVTMDPDSDSEGGAVSVVEGGRSEADPRTPGEKPDLRVADLPGDGHTDEVPMDASEPAGPVLTQVKVLRTGLRGSARSESIPGLGQAGWIQVAGNGGPDGAWQTLYKGERSRLYRIGCTQGSLDVTVEGESIERLRAGQSIDVQGTLVRVSAVDDGSGRGGYAWISQPEGEE